MSASRDRLSDDKRNLSVELDNLRAVLEERENELNNERTRHALLMKQFNSLMDENASLKARHCVLQATGSGPSRTASRDNRRHHLDMPPSSSSVGQSTSSGGFSGSSGLRRAMSTPRRTNHVGPPLATSTPDTALLASRRSPPLSGNSGGRMTSRGATISRHSSFVIRRPSSSSSSLVRLQHGGPEMTSSPDLRQQTDKFPAVRATKTLNHQRR